MFGSGPVMGPRSRVSRQLVCRSRVLQCDSRYLNSQERSPSHDCAVAPRMLYTRTNIHGRTYTDEQGSPSLTASEVFPVWYLESKRRFRLRVTDADVPLCLGVWTGIVCPRCRPAPLNHECADVSDRASLNVNNVQERARYSLVLRFVGETTQERYIGSRDSSLDSTALPT